jgi:hypothetical protein
MGSSGSCLVSPLHRFLGCVFMRRQLQHIIKAEEFLTMIATGEPSVIAFRLTFICVVQHLPGDECFFQFVSKKIIAKGNKHVYYLLLVGFGRACAPVRCAHPSFWAHCHA